MLSVEAIYSSFSAPPTMTAQPSLHETYKRIQHSVMDLGEKRLWPDVKARAAMHRGLVRDQNSCRPIPVSFSDGNGPVEIAIFWRHRQEMLDLIKQAQEQVFGPFVDDILTAVGAKGTSEREKVERSVTWTSAEAAHTVVLVFSEHPSLLDETQRRDWRAVNSDQLLELGDALQSEVFDIVALGGSLTLQVWGYCVTGDGSMLLLLTDDEESGYTPPSEKEAPPRACIADLRSRLHVTGTRVLGALNSRPKALIHVTCGRFLDWPGDEGNEDVALGAAAQDAVNRVVVKYSAAFASGSKLPLSGDSFRAREAQTRRGGPGGAPSPPLPGLGAHVVVSEMELVRDVQWTMIKHEMHRKYSLRMERSL